MAENYIPVFPDFEPLDIGHKGIIEEYYRKNPPKVSELNFTEMFMWRKIRNIRVTMLNGNLCVCAIKNGNEYFYPPLGNNKIYETVEKLLQCLNKGKKEGKIYGFLEHETDSEEFNTGKLVFEESRDDADYIYLRESLANLAGRKLHAKRNNIRRFEKENPGYTFEAITAKNSGDCVDFQKKWCELKDCGGDESLMQENCAVLEILKNWERLSAFGGLIRINGKVEGYTIGEELNPETAIVIVEKANHNIKGIYQVINNLFCKEMLRKYIYVNREQDVAHGGIRKAKMSYLPDHFVFKKTVRLA